MIRGARLHHVGIAVPSIASALPFYREAIGLATGEVHDVPGQGVRAVFIGEGAARVELVEPIDDASGVARFLKERGRPTLHHVCFAVDDLPGALRALEGRGYELIDREPRRGIEGMVAFLHPRAADGVLVELIDRGT